MLVLLSQRNLKLLLLSKEEMIVELYEKPIAELISFQTAEMITLSIEEGDGEDLDLDF